MAGARADKAKSDPQYFSQLLAKGLDKFDISAVVPKAAVRLVSKEPDVAKIKPAIDDAYAKSHPVALLIGRRPSAS